jgi:hypothetical protein
VAITVEQSDLVARLQAQHAGGMARGIFRQLQHRAGAEFGIAEKPWQAHGIGSRME